MARTRRQTVSIGNDPKLVKKVQINDEDMEKVTSYVKKARTSTISFGEKLDLLLLNAKIRHDHYVETSKKHPGLKRAGPNATAIVAETFHRRKLIVNDVWSSFWNQQKVNDTQGQKGNFNAKTRRIPVTNLVTNSVQLYVRERREKRIRTVAMDVALFLNDIGILHFDPQCPTSSASARRATQRFLTCVGYKRGKKNGMKNLRLTEKNMRLRDEYVATMVNLNADGRRRIVYMDESYIHKNYSRHEDSLFDPNDEQDLQVKAQHKGERYCFIGAIITEDTCLPSLPDNLKPESAKTHFMMDVYDIFKGGKQTKDYHGMFDGSYFIRWMEKLLDTLDDYGVGNAVIVMDNAKYHKTAPVGTPKGSTKKADLLSYCERNDINLSEDDKCLRSTLWYKVKAFIEKNVHPVICQMAIDRGHQVIFSPPHHSDLQPIELVWANVKGSVGRKYTTETTMQDVLKRINEAFLNLKSKTVDGCIRKANKHLMDLYDHINKMDLIEENNSDENPDEHSDSQSSDDSDTDSDV